MEQKLAYFVENTKCFEYSNGRSSKEASFQTRGMLKIELELKRNNLTLISPRKKINYSFQENAGVFLCSK